MRRWSCARRATPKGCTRRRGRGSSGASLESTTRTRSPPPRRSPWMDATPTARCRVPLARQPPCSGTQHATSAACVLALEHKRARGSSLSIVVILVRCHLEAAPCAQACREAILLEGVLPRSSALGLSPRSWALPTRGASSMPDPGLRRLSRCAGPVCSGTSDHMGTYSRHRCCCDKPHVCRLRATLPESAVASLVSDADFRRKDAGERAQIH